MYKTLLRLLLCIALVSISAIAHADDKERNSIIKQALSRLPEGIVAGIAFNLPRFLEGDNAKGILDDPGINEDVRRIVRQFELYAVFAANKPAIPRVGIEPTKNDVYPLTFVLTLATPIDRVFEAKDIDSFIQGYMGSGGLYWNAGNAKKHTVKFRGAEYDVWQAERKEQQYGAYRADDRTLYLGTPEILEQVITRKNAEATPFVGDLLPLSEAHQFAFAASGEWINQIMEDQTSPKFRALMKSWKSVWGSMDLSGKPFLEISITCNGKAGATELVEIGRGFREWLGKENAAKKKPDDYNRLVIGYAKAAKFDVEDTTARGESRPEPFLTLRQIVLRHVFGKR